MNAFYPHLFQPLKVGNLYFRNRIVASPTQLSQVTAGNIMHESCVSILEAKAWGGAAMVQVGMTAVDWEYGRHRDFQLNLWSDEANLELANLVDRIHYAGALCSIQLSHAGAYADPRFIKNNPIAASPLLRPDGVQVEEMTEEQMRRTADHFAEAAGICKNCGFDLIMLQMAHGWLLSGFLSPFENRRTDQYGGSLENRARFPIMVIDRIREEVGSYYPINVRISVSEGDPRGLQPEESIQFLKMIQDKIDLVSESFGTKWAAATRSVSNPCSYLPYGCNLPYAKMLKESGLKLPVIAVGSLDVPEVAEQAIAEGCCDMISLGRGMIADPDWARKAMLGKSDEIIPCLKCMECLDKPGGNEGIEGRINYRSTHRFGCSANPETGRRHLRIPPAQESRRVYVIGGGPAGMQAAITASQRGHKVTLLEASDHLGGALLHADKVPFKFTLKRFKDYQINMISKLPIQVRLNTTATPQLLEKEQPEAIIAAVGAVENAPPIPGIQRENVCFAKESHDFADRLGERIVIVGGGQVGCETGIYMDQLGKQVTVLEMREALAPDATFSHRPAMLERMEHIRKLVHTKCVEILPAGVRIELPDGTQTVIDADNVILAVGFKPQDKLAMSFADIAPQFCRAGDCIAAQNVRFATSSGYNAALQIL